MERKSIAMDDGDEGLRRVESTPARTARRNLIVSYLCIPLISLMVESHVILPKELAKTLPKSRLLTESEWRGIGVQQSRGWQHYAIHR